MNLNRNATYTPNSDVSRPFFSMKETILTETFAGKSKRHLVAHGDYSSTANCRANIPAIFKHFYFFITRFFVETLNNVLWNTG